MPPRQTPSCVPCAPKRVLGPARKILGSGSASILSNTRLVKIEMEGASVTAPKLGYYTRDTGTYVAHYFMGDEPPDEQYVLRGEAWRPLSDRWHLMDMVIDGAPDLSGPVRNPPKGVPPANRHHHH